MVNMLNIQRDISIAYEKSPGKSPGVMFCGGFMSDMTGTKAMALEKFCREQGQAFIRFDYQGHGQSSGKFSDGTISQWFADALAVFDQLIEGPQILVGSSMGGWIALLIVLARPERVKAFVGIAAAPDFTEDLMWEKYSDAQQQQLIQEGMLYEPSEYGEQPYAITKQLIEDGRNNLLLRAPITLNVPVRLLQGMKDDDVPWQRSLMLAEKLQSNDVRTILVKDGDHRLSRDVDLKLLMETVREFF